MLYVDHEPIDDLPRTAVRETCLNLKPRSDRQGLCRDSWRGLWWAWWGQRRMPSMQVKCVLLALFLLPLGGGIMGCCTRVAGGGVAKMEEEQPVPEVKPLRACEAFARGIAEVNRRAFRVDEANCRFWIWRDSKMNRWWMKVVRLPMIVGGNDEILIGIDDSGSIEFILGF